MHQPPFKADQLSTQSKSHAMLQSYLKSCEHGALHYEDESINHTVSFYVAFIPRGLSGMISFTVECLFYP